jgi:hypothetical protein
MHGRTDHPEVDRRTLVVAVALTFVALGLAGVTAPALIGHDTHQVVTTSAGQHSPDTTAKPISTTTATVATVTKTSLPATTAPSTTRYVPAPTTLTTSPATTPSTRPLPKTTTTVARTASLQINPATARFPATPPPYWPMPIVPVTIINTGGVGVRSIVVHPVGVYSIPSSTCTTLMPGQSCVAEVQFCPTSPNHYLDALIVTGQDMVTGSPLRASITLDGTAT